MGIKRCKVHRWRDQKIYKNVSNDKEGEKMEA